MRSRSRLRNCWRSRERRESDTGSRAATFLPVTILRGVNVTCTVDPAEARECALNWLAPETARGVTPQLTLTPNTRTRADGTAYHVPTAPGYSHAQWRAFLAHASNECHSELT